MGLSSKKQTTDSTSSSTSNSTSNSTSANQSTSSSQANVPDWLLHPAQTQAGLIGQLQANGPAQYTPQTSGLQQQAFDSAGGLQTTNLGYGQAKDAMSNVGNISADHVTAGSVLDNLSNYYNPYQDQVLNPVMADLDQQAGQTRASQAADAANGAFNSTRYGVTQSLTEGELARARASTMGGLLGGMYDNATGLSAADQNRQLQAGQANQSADLQAAQANQSGALQKAGLLAQIANDKQSTIRANLAAQDQMGGEATAQGNTARQYPVTFAGQTGTLLQGLNPNDYGGKTISSSGSSNLSGTENSTSNSKSNSTQVQQDSLLGGLGQAAQIAALMAGMSDRRLKVGVRRIGRDPKGRRLYEFAYRWAPAERVVGVMAQDIMASDPQAVRRGPGGFYSVDYGAL